MTRPSDADAQLSRACRHGDRQAWSQLVRRFSPQVYRLALRMLGQRHEAEDASQEVFVRVHRSFGTYDASRPLSPWIARITYNVCLRRLQRAGARLEREGDVEERPDEARSPEERASMSEVEQVLEAYLDELPAQDRALLVMRYRDGLSDAEVAGATGMPVGTVKTRIFRARARLRERLAPHVEAP